MRSFIGVCLLLGCLQAVLAQVGGGSVYNPGQGSGRAAAEAAEHAKRSIKPEEFPPDKSSTFMEASVLINVPADEYVAVFGISEEAPTLAECRQKAEAKLHGLRAALSALGIGEKDVTTDFVAQNRTYGYDVDGNIAKEKLTGFELKDNVIVHYRSPELLDKMVAAAARAQVFDLIKVDYVVKDVEAAHARLFQEASRLIKSKAAKYSELLEVKLKPAQVYAERFSAYYPTNMYDSYAAAESEDVMQAYNSQRIGIQARKMRTFYYNALGAETFDTVLNPVVTQPVVQFSLYLKLRYDTASSPG